LVEIYIQAIGGLMNTVILHQKVILTASTSFLNAHYNILKKWFLRLLCLILIATIVTLTGCATSKYKLAKKDTPPLTPLNLSINQSPVDTLVHTVIVYKGPGSWKRKAYWDEYVMTLANQGDNPMIVKTATLVDFQDKYNAAGSDPWALEKQSKTWWKNFRSSDSGHLVTLGLGTYVSVGVFYGAGLAALGSGSGALAGVAFVGAAGIVALPVYAIVSSISNVSARHKIEEEFNRRRIVLPATIDQGQSVQGSLFFPITPGPKRLILQCQIGEETREFDLDLPQLADLHFNDGTNKKLSASSKK
jgi:hypothetical protein